MSSPPGGNWQGPEDIQGVCTAFLTHLPVSRPGLLADTGPDSTQGKSAMLTSGQALSRGISTPIFSRNLFFT
jgi:hypothetical protein